jgi:hypothetical protein
MEEKYTPEFIKKKVKFSLDVLNCLEKYVGTPEEVCNKLPLTTRQLVDNYIEFERLSRTYNVIIEANPNKINKYKELLK